MLKNSNAITMMPYTKIYLKSHHVVLQKINTDQQKEVIFCPE